MASEDFHANQGVKILAVQIFLITISFTTILLRLLSKKMSNAGYGWDDLLILLALVRI